MVATKKDKVNGDCLGTGRRKKAIARVRIRPGSGKIIADQERLSGTAQALGAVGIIKLAGQRAFEMSDEHGRVHSATSRLQPIARSLISVTGCGQRWTFPLR